MKSISILKFVLAFSIALFKNISGIPIEDYVANRKMLMDSEDAIAFGGKLVLKGNEISANECLMKAKYKEVDEGIEQFLI